MTRISGTSDGAKQRRRWRPTFSVKVRSEAFGMFSSSSSVGKIPSGANSIRSMHSWLSANSTCHAHNLQRDGAHPCTPGCPQT